MNDAVSWDYDKVEQGCVRIFVLNGSSDQGVNKNGGAARNEK